jgi:nucleotide-binding universal stress UspA family protein
VAGMIGAIIVGTDGSQTAGIAVGEAIDIAQALGARLTIVSAYEPVPEGRLRTERLAAPADVQWAVNPREDVLALLQTAANQARSAGVSEVDTVARVGDAADAIIDVAEEQRSDLIVIGNKGMTGATRFLLGSVPNKVSHHAPCSVMIVRTT